MFTIKIPEIKLVLTPWLMENKKLQYLQKFDVGKRGYEKETDSHKSSSLMDGNHRYYHY